MIQRTVIVCGPGGSGKSPLDHLFRDDIERIESYRLRPDGPRNGRDTFYGNPRLYRELHVLLETLGDEPLMIGTIEWFSKSKTMFFNVRGEDQFLTLGGLDGEIAKAEIYAPFLPDILSDPEICQHLGDVDIMILNPSCFSIAQMENLDDLKEKTDENCYARGDTEIQRERRVASIAEEAPAWKRLIEEFGAIEYWGWQFPEYRYTRPPQGMSLLDHQKGLLVRARDCLLTQKADLVIFLKSEQEIDSISEPFV